MFSEHLTEFHGLPVFNLPAGGSDEPLPAPETVAWRLGCGWGEGDFDDLWRRFLDTVDTTRVRALVFGAWSQEMYEADLGKEVQRVVDAADRLPALTAFFLADVTSEENEVSWIEQTDLAPLLTAYPRLEQLGARGGHRQLTPVRHEALRVLRLESGGMSAAVTRSLAACELPALERLELMFGTDEYGGDSTIEDIAPLLTGTLFPALRHLALMDSEVEDAIAGAVARSPVLPRLETLSLALGVLTDAGGEGLLSGQPLTHLKELDLHHHYLSDEMMIRIREALEPAGVVVHLTGRQTAEESHGRVYRYVAVGE